MAQIKERNIDVLLSLGKIVAHGMERCDQTNQFIDRDVIENKYITHFPMPDGREWVITVKRKRDGTDA